jgi:hypothetical protein
MYITGKAAEYISDLLDKVVAGQVVTLEDLLKRLHSAYQEINPVVKAQREMDAIMDKSYKKLLDFAEAFRPVAFKTQFSDQDLIKRINEKCSQNLINLMVALNQTPGTIPTTWEAYLSKCLELDTQLRDEKNTTTKATTSTLANTVGSAPQKLSDEQIEWVKKHHCLHCGEKFEKGHKCKNPKYSGHFENFQRHLPKKDTVIRAVETGTVNAAKTTKEQDEFNKFYESWKQKQAQGQAGVAAIGEEDIQTSASHQFFLNGL